jgi:hypothetical protein
MADPREVFWTLKDGNAEGAAAQVRVEGEASAAIPGAIGFAFKDSSGNVILPQLNAAGELPVTFDTGTQKRACGELAAGSLTMAAVTNASITLTASKPQKSIAMICSCRRDSMFQLIQLDDVTETVLAEVVVGPGQFTFQVALPEDQIVAGATGVQKLLVKGMNFDKLSSLRATITCIELP